MDTNPSGKRHAYNPASLALMAEGVSQRTIAEHIGCDFTYVSRQLAGHDRLTPTLPVALAELLGAEAAERIVGLVPSKPERATVAPS
jgi:hypothetical protein